MTGTVKFKGTSLHFKDEGQGDVVVLLHGYLESLAIWGTFAGKLAGNYRIISVDLPGHGRSGNICEIHTMEIMADSVKTILKQLGIGRAVIIGHSMGGYVTLAFAEIFPEVTVGYCLFHSHALADNEEKKVNRVREIDLVKAGKKMQIINTNIPKTFADKNLVKFKGEVERAIKIAAATPDSGIICALEGMKTRPDRKRVLIESTIPVLIIAGKLDNNIPFNIYQEHFNLAPIHHKIVLDNSGHMGFIEEQEKVLDGILKFLKTIY